MWFLIITNCPVPEFEIGCHINININININEQITKSDEMVSVFPNPFYNLGERPLDFAAGY